MTSEHNSAFVWIWLPGTTDPVVAGRLDRSGDLISFTYGRSYLERENAIPLFTPDLPLARGEQIPTYGTIAGCIEDAAPDAWGRRVILNRLVGPKADTTETLDELTYLLESGSDRIGALDFQIASDRYVARNARQATVGELLSSADRVQEGIPLSEEIDAALLHGSSIGGARPKATLMEGDKYLIAKFSSTTDSYPVVKGEFAAMELGRRVGLEVAETSLKTVMGREVILIRRFDRLPGGARKLMVSALTILGLDEMSGRYASYPDLADQIRLRFDNPKITLRELFSRLVFSILVGNTDDHARNHAGFWNGSELTLTPAYDICPQPRSGGEASQAMAITKSGERLSQVVRCVDNSSIWHLTPSDAREIVDHQISVITREFPEVADLARMTEVDRKYFWKRQFLNPYALYGY